MYALTIEILKAGGRGKNNIYLPIKYLANEGSSDYSRFLPVFQHHPVRYPLGCFTYAMDHIVATIDKFNHMRSKLNTIKHAEFLIANKPWTFTGRLSLSIILSFVSPTTRFF